MVSCYATVTYCMSEIQVLLFKVVWVAKDLFNRSRRRRKRRRRLACVCLCNCHVIRNCSFRYRSWLPPPPISLLLLLFPQKGWWSVTSYCLSSRQRTSLDFFSLYLLPIRLLEPPPPPPPFLLFFLLKNLMTGHTLQPSERKITSSSRPLKT